MTGSPTTPDRDDDMLAAEYVTGVLPFEERNNFKVRLASSAALRELVHSWEEHFIALADDINPVAAPVHLWNKIESRLFAPTEVQTSWLQSLAFWRGVSFASLAAFALAATLYMQKLDGLSGTVENYVAELSSPDSAVRLVAFYDAGKNQIKLNRVASSAAAGRVFQLWLIEGKNPPVSLGILPDAQNGTLLLNAAIKPKFAGAVLAISDEPTGGSPTGQPTGAVLATGNIHAV